MLVTANPGGVVSRCSCHVMNGGRGIWRGWGQVAHTWHSVVLGGFDNERVGMNSPICAGLVVMLLIVLDKSGRWWGVLPLVLFSVPTLLLGQFVVGVGWGVQCDMFAITWCTCDVAVGGLSACVGVRLYTIGGLIERGGGGACICATAVMTMSQS